MYVCLLAHVCVTFGYDNQCVFIKYNVIGLLHSCSIRLLFANRSMQTFKNICILGVITIFALQDAVS